MNKTTKQIIGALIGVGLLATIGAVIVSAHPGFFNDLTDEQKEELRDMKQELIKENASCKEIREAMQIQLEDYGFEFPTREEIIDKQINITKHRLEILEIIKELIQENPNITNEEIREIIQSEFELSIPFDDGQSMMCHHRFNRGFGFRSHDFMDKE